jgi:SAM-dependent methyltransferase
MSNSVDAKADELERLLRRAERKTRVASWIPKPFRGLFRRQGSFNQILLDLTGSLADSTVRLAGRVERLASSQVAQADGATKLELQRLQNQIDRVREQANWLAGEVRHLREAVDVVDFEFVKATLLQQGKILQWMADESRGREAELRQTLQAVAAQAQSAHELLHQQAAQLHAMESGSQQLNEVVMHFTAAPYTSDAGAVRTTDAQGRPAIGFREATAIGAGQESYAAFESVFRGPEELIRERQRTYLDDLRGHEPVVDLGCGRGEMLDLLQEANVRAIGVDSDASMARRAISKGHTVMQQDALEYLAAQPDKSIGAIFCAQVVEHLSLEDMLRLLRLGIEKVKPNGVVILETVNPHSHRALKTFWVDLTHNKPIFPEVLVAFCRQFGYREAIVRFPVGEGDLERDRLSQGEYAVVARTPE